jgi:hypothetical protein
MQKRMTPEEKAEMRRHEKELIDELLAVKWAISAEVNALKTAEEHCAYYKQIGDNCRALGFNVVSRPSVR